MPNLYLLRQKCYGQGYFFATDGHTHRQLHVNVTRMEIKTRAVRRQQSSPKGNLIKIATFSE